MRLSIVAGLGCALAALAEPAAAHPHVFVDAKTELVFDREGRVVSVRNVWQFDKAFTAYAIQGLDADRDGKLSAAELRPLAQTNVEALQEYKYFTFLRIGGKDVAFAPPSEYWLQFVSGRLTLFYTLPLKEPMATTGGAVLDVFDPEYFVAISFAEQAPIQLIDAPARCKATFEAPGQLSAGDAAKLSAIPADRRDLPAPLSRVTLGLANTFKVTCG